MDTACSQPITSGLINRYLPITTTATLQQVANYKTRNKQLDQPTKVGLAILGVLAVLLCCGGITAINALTDSGQVGFEAASDATTAPAPVPATTTSGNPNPEPTTAKPSPTKTASKKPSPKPVYYPNCTAVRDAGKAPLRKGQPGYRTALDRDRDGRACESSEGPPPGSGGDDGGDDPPASVYYPNCAAVRAAGAAPIRRGDPGYGSHLDRDGDGVACE